MGRWGYRLFEGDQDHDILSDVSYDIRRDTTLAGIASYLDGESDPLCPDDADLASAGAKLDAGLGDKIFQKFRALEVGGEDPHRARYTVIIVGALMMRAGAKISQDDLKHLRELVPTIASSEGFALAFCDEGFRGPGERQFLAALDNHQAGTPRDFLRQRSCFACGKTAKEIGSPILKCGGCEHAWFCDKDCQRGFWRAHKPQCGPRRGILMNV